ncbi:Ig-like domain-containing protein, partial [Psychrobacter sp. NG27]|uniref:Ig-like domain-containing protein n=1 Tax=Psychrobacter sp. NG27 TaxID=2781966 RepID=UPI0018DF2B4D
MNTIIVKTNDATQTISQVQVATKDGTPTIITAMDRVNYEFHDTAIGRAPNHIITKRIKNDLHVSFEKDGQESDLIIEGFYEEPDSALIGIAEDGEYYYYIPDTGETYDYVTQLEVGDVEGQALGGEDYVAVAAIPWWIPAAAALGLAGIAAALSGRGDDNVIAPVKNAPVATDGAISTPEGTVIAVPLIASDIDGVVEGITLTTLPDAAQGVLSYTNAAGDSVPVVAGTPLSAAEAATVLFTPTENFNGAVDDIEFFATDDDGLDSAPATVTVNVTDVNTPPTADDQSLTTDEDTAVSVPLIGADIDGTVVSVTVLQVPPANQGVLTYEDNGQTVELTPGTVLTADQITSVMFTPALNFNGRVSNIQFTTTDDDGAISAPATVKITVTPIVDITHVVIMGDENIIEGEEAGYTVKFLDESGNPVIVTQDTDVTVTFNNGSTQDADTEYNNAQTITVTIPAGQSSAALNVDTIDDYLADDGENYSLTITSVGANEFEAVDFSDEATNTVTTTIDSNNAGDSANEGGLDSNDSVYVKLTGDDSQIEADDAVLTHTLSLVDADGQPV